MFANKLNNKEIHFARLSTCITEGYMRLIAFVFAELYTQGFAFHFIYLFTYFLIAFQLISSVIILRSGNNKTSEIFAKSLWDSFVTQRGDWRRYANSRTNQLNFNVVIRFWLKCIFKTCLYLVFSQATLIFKVI